ncbi:ATP-binding protein [uncultured Eubacterium sp.]|uniref:ATP-binding protein n=1 Tax=uncultured Eubacterium sp. TaxID=165185 RepID=UPI0025F5BCB4|nr:ATP-binding protein [uncultured Eubacterium sp.]MCI6536714.1 ATP-binding protein [Lachnospiraceae bacterium]
MVNGIVDFCTTLGAHIWLIVIACIEVVVGIFLLGTALNRKRRKRQLFGKNELHGIERIFLETCNAWDKEGYLMIRRADLMPVYMTDGCAQLLEISLEKLQENIRNLGVNIADREQEKAIWEKYWKWDGSGELNLEAQLKNGNWVLMVCHQSPDRMYDVISVHNRTGVHEKMQAYEDRLDAAEDASQSKTTFLYRMSHEIRTPMNGIMGMLTLAKGKLHPDHAAMQYLEKTEEISEHLLALINDILDMSRIEAGKVELEEKVFSIHAMGQGLYDMFAKTLEARGIHYAVNYEDMTVDYVLGDQLRLNQVIINFLSNAVKFTSEGEITVTFRQMMIREDIVDLMICVHDTGIGMDPAFVQRIFRPFEQESVETSQKYGGTGLGMAITDQIVKLMGGDIVVQTLTGRGSDFSVFLHLPIANEEMMQKEKTVEVLPQQEECDLSGRRILLAEDNEINAMIAEEILREMGAELEIAADGQKAFEAFCAHPEHYYDVILMDIQMPVMDGREATRRIRALERSDAADVVIFGLSADAFVEDERQSLECGMDAHYAKPIDFEVLKRNINMFLHEKKRV